ncbi:hypothetical protein AC249_AIPGENE6783 [Exaiptasia diaphana]|nr:hypothetical protein AC249_AIPGENE6783 [Exaiptasia diaphana]
MFKSIYLDQSSQQVDTTPNRDKSFALESTLDELESTSLEKLNSYLASPDISPVRHKLTVPWEEASERTKRHYIRKGREVTDEEFEDELDTDERDIQNLSEEVNNSTGLQHPILYETFNLCQLSKKSKLTGFSISMLKEICHSLGLDTSTINVRLKKPYIELLECVLSRCSCSRTDES